MLNPIALRMAREARGLKPSQAADRAQVSRAYWLNLEAGRKHGPSGDVLVRLAEAVGVTVESIVTRRDVIAS